MPKIFDSKNRPQLCIDDLDKSGSYKSQWGSFVVKPEKINFDSLDENEEIILLGRRHFVTNLNWIFTLLVLAILPFFWGEFPFFASLSVNVHFGVLIMWYLAISFFFLMNFLLWFYNVYILTNERLISLEFLGLMNKTLNVTNISKIEDVSFSQKGILQNMFDFGDVIAQTSSEQRTADVAQGEMSTFTFNSVGNPNEVVNVISELMEIAEENK